MLYRLIWLLLHFLNSCHEGAVWLAGQLRAAINRRSYDGCNGRKAHTVRDFGFLSCCRLEMRKIPRHLSVILGPEEVANAAELFSRIIIYALSMDIRYVSFFDTRPATAKGATPSPIVLDDIQLPAVVKSKRLQDDRVLCTWSHNTLKNGKRKTEANGHKYGGGCQEHGFNHDYQKSTEVIIIKMNQGRELIAKMCQKLHQQRRLADVQNLLTSRMSLMQWLDGELRQELYNLPDPELAIVFNRVPCTFGLLPWHTCFTEFHTMRHTDCFDVETFAQLMRHYSRCEQRWGK